MRVAIDTNILVYAEGVGDDARRCASVDLVRRVPLGHGVTPVQVLGELFTVLRRKGGQSPAGARAAIEKWGRIFDAHQTSVPAFGLAIELASAHGLQIWDAIILAAAAEADCAVLLSEDMQSGFVWRGVTIVDPFAREPHPLLAAALDPA